MPPRPTELVLMARVARDYYHDDRSKNDIADELGISRFRVARLLDAAQARGHRPHPDRVARRRDTDLSVELQRVFGLSARRRGRRRRRASRSLRDPAGRGGRRGVAGDRRHGRRARAGLGAVAARRSAAHHEHRAVPRRPAHRRAVRTGRQRRHRARAPRRARRRRHTARLLRPARRARRRVRASAAPPARCGPRRGARRPGDGRRRRHRRCGRPGLSTIYDMVEPEARERAQALGAIGEISGALIDAHGRTVQSAVEPPHHRRHRRATGRRSTSSSPWPTARTRRRRSAPPCAAAWSPG